MRCASQMSQHEIGVQRTTKRLGASQSDVAGRMLKRIRFCTQEPKQSHPPTRRLTCLLQQETRQRQPRINNQRWMYRGKRRLPTQAEPSRCSTYDMKIMPMYHPLAGSDRKPVLRLQITRHHPTLTSPKPRGYCQQAETQRRCYGGSCLAGAETRPCTLSSKGW